jgi:transcriptional regulator with XRE-family HTH domain
MDNTINYKLIGERIKNKRKEMKFTQEQLSEVVGIGVQHMSKIENGKASLSLSCLIALANTLQTTPDHLLMDNVTAAIPNLLNEVKIFFDDCSNDEIFIIMKTAATLRECIRQKGKINCA